MDAARQYSTRDAARILQTTESRIRNWARLGGVDAGGGSEFTFQQLLLLRTTRGLLEAGIPAKRVRRVWSSLRRQLHGDLPLTSVRILANGSRAVAWDENASWQPDSGQFLLDFDAEEIAERAAVGAVSALRILEDPPAPLPIPEPTRTADQWFELGCELEETSPLEARQAYVQAIAVDPNHADAHLNLGRLDHAIGELGKAEAHYQRAVQCDPDDAVAHFNLGVLLEDRDRPEEAVQAYHQAVVRDPDMADAHYNLGLLLESRGRRDDALKHLMAARRLYEGTVSAE